MKEEEGRRRRQEDNPVEEGGCTTQRPPPDQQPTDEETLAFERQVKSSYLTNISCVGEEVRVGFADLQAEYAQGLPIFLTKLSHLATRYTGLRAVRKDGNCFYRAFAFRLAELLLEYSGRRDGGGAPDGTDDCWSTSIIAKAKATRDLVAESGYDAAIFEDFWEPFEQALSAPNQQALLQLFNTDYLSDTIVCYLRIVTAATLKRDKELYEAFIFDTHPSMDDFIGSQVEPMAIEADQIHIVALSNTFGIKFSIANLDASKPAVATDPVNFHAIEPMDGLLLPDAKYSIHLLYRPGHYDVLYPCNQ